MLKFLDVAMSMKHRHRVVFYRHGEEVCRGIIVIISTGNEASWDITLIDDNQKQRHIYWRETDEKSKFTWER
jgi:hypothetical protein